MAEENLSHKEVDARIAPLRSRLYAAAGLARLARRTLESCEHSEDADVNATGCALEELEALIANINDDLDPVKLHCESWRPRAVA